jgi:hypothetical protein
VLLVTEHEHDGPRQLWYKSYLIVVMTSVRLTAAPVPDTVHTVDMVIIQNISDLRGLLSSKKLFFIFGIFPDDARL